MSCDLVVIKELVGAAVIIVLILAGAHDFGKPVE